MTASDPAGMPPDPVHGGPDAQGAAAHDFSTNANACGPCPAALAAVRQADAARYPDPQYTALCERLGHFHGVDAARIVVAAGASEFIARITAAVAQRGGRRVHVPAHAYGDYRHAAEARGLAVPGAPHAAIDADLVWCCEPSSPLGQSQDDLRARIDALGAHAQAVLDLAYEPLRLEGRLALTAAERDRVWQLWSPNKALGLTGVRAAYAIAPQGASEMAARMGRLAPSWPLGAHGVALLDAWAGDEVQVWLAGNLDTLRTWKRQQQALCAELGWRCLPSVSNFFCAVPDVPYPPRARALRDAGVQLRDAASFGLAGHVRLSVQPPASQMALRDAWVAARTGA